MRLDGYMILSSPVSTGVNDSSNPNLTCNSGYAYIFYIHPFGIISMDTHPYYRTPFTIKCLYQSISFQIVIDRTADSVKPSVKSIVIIGNSIEPIYFNIADTYMLIL